MRMRVDSKADAIYLHLSDSKVEASEEVADGTILDFDKDGRVIGIEILDASQKTGDPSVLQSFQFDLPKAS